MQQLKLNKGVDKLTFLNQEERSVISNIIFNQKQYKWKLLYHPAKGQDNYQYCRAAFYDHSSVVVFIETMKGCKFGVYTSVGWDSEPESNI